MSYSHCDRYPLTTHITPAQRGCEADIITAPTIQYLVGVGKRRIGMEYSSHPLIKLLGQYTEVEFTTPLGDAPPQPVHHVHWIHRAATEARLANAALMIVPPDTLWNDGVFAFTGEALAAGKKAVITPLTQVVLETLVPEARKLYQPTPQSPLTITGAEMAELSLRHLHPVSCLPLEQSPHARPAIDQYWTVPGEGLVERHSQREMFAFDPARIPMTFLWYPGTLDDEDIIFPDNSDVASMLSLDPLYKSFPTYILNHHVAPLDIARMSLHPLNDMPLIDFYVSRRVRWHGERVSESAWKEIEDRADNAFLKVQASRRLLRVWGAADSSGCALFCRLLAVAVNVLELDMPPFINETKIVLIPTDAALAASGINATYLVKNGNEESLRTFFLDHFSTQTQEQVGNSGLFNTLSGKTLTVSVPRDGALCVSGTVANQLSTMPDTPCCFVLGNFTA